MLSGQGEQTFLEKMFVAKRRNCFEFAHLGFQFAHSWV